jgi:multiple sugar transport system substrate-binding protein
MGNEQLVNLTAHESARRIDRRRLMQGATALGLSTFSGPFLTRRASAQEPVTIEFWNPEVEDYFLKVLGEVIVDFEAANPGIKINLVNVPWGDIYPKFVAAVESGNVPDIAMANVVYGGSLNLLGALEPVDDIVEQLGGEEEFFAPSAASFVQMNKRNGSFYAMPNVHNSVVLWYRKDLLAAANLGVPTTWDELLTAAEVLTKDGIYGILTTASKSHVTDQGFYTLMLSNGAEALDHETGEENIFDSPNTVEALDFYQALSQYSPPGASGYDRPEAQAAMTTGRIAMFVYGSWLGGALQAAGPEIFQQFGAASVPTSKGKGAFMGNNSFIAFKNGQHMAEGKEFIKFLMTPENYIKFLPTNPPGYIPIIKSVWEDPAYTENEQIKQHQEVIEASRAGLADAWINFVPNPRAGELEGLHVLSDVASPVLLGDMDSSTSVKEGAARIEEIISQS